MGISGRRESTQNFYFIHNSVNQEKGSGMQIPKPLCLQSDRTEPVMALSCSIFEKKSKETYDCLNINRKRFAFNQKLRACSHMPPWTHRGKL